MKELIINGEESGIRLDKFLEKLLPNAGRSFLYKMLRKKNITLNGKKAEGSERLREQDHICIFFSDETYEQFRRGRQPKIGSDAASERNVPPHQDAVTERHSSTGERNTTETARFPEIPVVYEDGDMLIVDKPAGLLTQRAQKDDTSLNDWLCAYVSCRGSCAAHTDNEDKNIKDTDIKDTPPDRLIYTPSAVNRLDRNTSGLVLCAKTYPAARTLSRLLHDRMIGKYYLALVKGQLSTPQTLKGFLSKDAAQNHVVISDDGEGEEIHTAYVPLFYLDRHDMTLLRVRLFTGKPHQIRAHLASISHPVCGDPKYGDIGLNRYLRSEYKINRQLLHAYAVCFPKQTAGRREWAMTAAGKTITAPPPQDFMRLLHPYHIGETLWQRGIQEDFEVPPLRI
ncbi:MAG: RluA family pseudouridine synthase [Clostridium sp.]|nr:RluA family pseudouridine synthase [Clostridium sp.]